MNKFKDDSERIQELKKCLETSLVILDECTNIDDGYLKARTLIKDVLARFNEDKKFLTADVIIEGDLELLNE